MTEFKVKINDKAPFAHETGTTVYVDALAEAVRASGSLPTHESPFACEIWVDDLVSAGYGPYRYIVGTGFGPYTVNNLGVPQINIHGPATWGDRS